MDKFNFLNDLSKKLSDALPQSLQLLKKDIQKNFHAVLQNAFGKLDLVTREEFDAQCRVLLRKREKLEALERRLS